jgi:hypothetical protein
MNLDEVEAGVGRAGGVFEYIHYHQINPVWLPDDAPAEIKCAWIRLYNQGRKDVEIIEAWLYDMAKEYEAPDCPDA